MKRIALFILVLLFAFSATTFAQEVRTYEASDYFTVTFPESWKVNVYDNNHQAQSGLILEGISPNKKPSLGIFLYNNQNKNIDDLTTATQKRMSNIDKSMILEDSGKLYIDNRETRFLLYSSNNQLQVKHYYFNYFALNEQYYYHILVIGHYNNLETDRKIIDGIISSIKILK